ncbi:hypothetical protein CCP2SC5_2380001 [Azospirillaceae bacterium]
MLGDKPAEVVKVGPPPGEFAKAGMTWNGKPFLSDEFLIECPDGESTVKEYNTEKEWLKIFSQVALGFSTINRRNCLLIMFKRKRDITTFLY